MVLDLASNKRGNRSDRKMADELGAFLKAAADPLRIQVLRLLAQDSYGVTELARVFAVKQSGMSHHLKILSQAGLVATRREGNSIFYRRALARYSEFADLLVALFEQIDQLQLNSEIETRLAQVRADRVASSQAFFNDNSEKFRSQQDLIAAYPVYAEPVTEFIEHSLAGRKQVAVEIGPGQGEFLAVLSPLYQQVIAFDINQAMLEQAASTIDRAGFTNVTLHIDDGCGLADMLADDNANLVTADLVVANMVLHHVPSPVTMFEQVQNVLASGGSFVITDLCLHDQNWARDACGDVWLGFDPDDLKSWAKNSGLEIGQSIYFALRNGFQIQIQQFVKA